MRWVDLVLVGLLALVLLGLLANPRSASSVAAASTLAAGWQSSTVR